MSIPVAETDQAPAGPATEPGLKYAWYVVLVLMICYTLSFIDRQILSMLIGPIKRDFNISDIGVGLLQGVAFLSFYTFMGLPVGWLVISGRSSPREWAWALAKPRSRRRRCR